MRKLLPTGIISLLALASFLSQATPVFTQTPTGSQASSTISSGIATMVDIRESVSPGDVISFTNNGYRKSTVEYDSNIFGVVVDTPAVVLENAGSAISRPVLSSGKAYVKVSSVNGIINPGDLVTASSRPGVAMKSTKTGYVIGTAIESHTTTNPNQLGTILVTLDIGLVSLESTTTSSNLIDSFKLALDAPTVSPVNALRYVLSALIVVMGFGFAVIFFGRASAAGIEAVGRNPLASRMIMISMVFHIALALCIVFVGIGLAYLILIL